MPTLFTSKKMIAVPYLARVLKVPQWLVTLFETVDVFRKQGHRLIDLDSGSITAGDLDPLTRPICPVATQHSVDIAEAFSLTSPAEFSRYLKQHSSDGKNNRLVWSLFTRILQTIMDRNKHPLTLDYSRLVAESLEFSRLPLTGQRKLIPVHLGALLEPAHVNWECKHAALRRHRPLPPRESMMDDFTYSVSSNAFGDPCQLLLLIKTGTTVQELFNKAQAIGPLTYHELTTFLWSFRSEKWIVAQGKDRWEITREGKEARQKFADSMSRELDALNHRIKEDVLDVDDPEIGMVVMLPRALWQACDIYVPGTLAIWELIQSNPVLNDENNRRLMDAALVYQMNRAGMLSMADSYLEILESEDSLDSDELDALYRNTNRTRMSVIVENLLSRTLRAQDAFPDFVSSRGVLIHISPPPLMPLDDVQSKATDGPLSSPRRRAAAGVGRREH